jgi:adenine-specific DNA methylase
VVFASLVPDPDDPSCPEEFLRAVERHLKTHISSELKYYRRGREFHRDEDPYHPYDGIADTLRNRLLTFIAKWSPEALAFESGKSTKKPKPAELLDDRSLAKWETSDPKNLQGSKVLHIAQELIKTAHGGKTPTVLDPFAGGGAIPLEAGRIGCQAIANDYNPVAYLILRATCEFPQKFGKPGRRKVIIEEFGKKIEREIDVSNVLIHDVEKYANWILEEVKGKIGHLYPPGEDRHPVVGYIWARTAPCSNPSCRAEIPLLGSLLLCSKQEKKTALEIKKDHITKRVRFGVVKGKEITLTKGTMQNRGNTQCPFCDQITPVVDIRSAGLNGKLGQQMVAVIIDTSSGKDYRPVEPQDLYAFEDAAKISTDSPNEPILPEITSRYEDNNVSNSTGIRVHLYGLKTWGSLFNSRQLVAMQTFVESVHEAARRVLKECRDAEYVNAVRAYLALWVSRIAQRSNNQCSWLQDLEAVAHPFSMQKISMAWDYPEVNPLSDSTGSGEQQLDMILRVIEHESKDSLPAIVHFGDAAHLPREDESVDIVVTDPPYFDAIAFGDLSDHFYVWLKRCLGNSFADVFATPLTPKSEEAAALKHRHFGNSGKADSHFRSKLAEALSESRRVTVNDGIISVMFAHQSTEAWTALIQALFKASLGVDASWPIDTERPNRSRGLDSSALGSSITAVCRPRILGTATSFKEVRNEIEQIIQKSVKRFWGYGLRGADLIVACYGPTVGVFGKYERVEKADGTPVEIPELLELARIAARDAIAGEFRGDNLSTLYYVWANLYGAAEQTWDDARLVVQIGGDAESAMEVARGHGIFVVDGSRCRLALLSDREKRRGLGIDLNPPLIDALHRSMLLWREEKRPELVSYLREHDLLEDGPFWKLAQALFEVLPRDTEDWKLISALLGERQTLRSEGKGLADQGPRYPLFGNR